MRRPWLLPVLAVAGAIAIAGIAIVHNRPEPVPDHPRLRNLSIVPTGSGRSAQYLVQDPELLGGDAVVLNASSAQLVPLLDGKRTTAEIAAEIVRRTGEEAARGAVVTLIEKLHDSFLLEGPRFIRRLTQVRDEWSRFPVRPLAAAASMYSASESGLRLSLGKLQDQAAKNWPRGLPEGSPRGIVIPHVEVDRGGAVEATAAYAFARGKPPAVIVLLAPAHGDCPEPLAFLPQDYATPLGIVATNLEVRTRLTHAYGKHAFDAAFAHRREHSIEVPLLFLQSALSGSPFQIVPVLCSRASLGAGASRDPRVTAFVSELRALATEKGPDLAIVASAGLTYAGRRFGDTAPPDRKRADEIRRSDLALLRTALAGDAAGVRALARPMAESSRACGDAPIVLLLEIFPGRTGRLLAYEQSPDSATGSLFTYAAAGYW